MAITASAPALTLRSATALAQAIRSREVTAREVVQAHVDRLHTRQPRTNALACDRFADALAEADAADARIREGGELPPFLGVPCTVKESIAVSGMPNCAGLVALKDRRSETTAPAVQRLIDAGFIPLGVTNTSEMTMWIESVNRVYGRTRNAYDPHRTAGGSSGGEGAAVGSGGSPVGLGSDIGGSIRVPAFFNGVFGHKPSPGLVPNTGQFPNTEGEAAYMLTLGPLARHAEDLMPVTRIISGPDGVDPRAVPRELGDPDTVDFSKLRVLLADEASVLPARKELREARDRAARALQELGARTEHVSLKQLRRGLEIYLAALGDGAGVSLAELLGQAGVQPRGARPWLDAVRGHGDHTPAMLITIAVERLNRYNPPGRIEKAVAAAHQLRAEVAEILGDDGLLLHHPHPRVAPRHGGTVGRAWVITSAAVFNLLGLPVTQVPLGLNPKGLPLGVQVAAGDGNDHLTIAAALALERRFGGWVPPAWS
jgi:Asp-tRNA(Asn)/Glu-tRNA(Gln) amidotransferase A subunit family amidase